MLIALVIVVGVVLVVGGFLLARLSRALFEQRLGRLEERLDRRLGDFDLRVGNRLDGLDGRLLSNQQSAGQTATQIVERLGKLDGTAAQMLQRANDLSRLEQALRPPKARGGFGEILLGKLLADILPADAYQLQFTFRSGERVDAVIRAEKLLPVDAKFPLDNFERVVNTDDDAERLLYEKAFARDVKGHVDAIATKYVRPAENTFDFAFMYLPSEAVYYELVNGRTGNLYAYSLSRRVFPVSPSTFHAFMLVILLGLRGLQIEQHAQEVMAYCAQLARDFERFRSDFDTIGKHIGNAQTKYGDADRRLGRLEAQVETSLGVGRRCRLSAGARGRAAARARRRLVLVPQQRADPLDRVEVGRRRRESTDSPTVRERVVDGEIETCRRCAPGASRQADRRPRPRPAARSSGSAMTHARRRSDRAGARRARRMQPRASSPSPTLRGRCALPRRASARAPAALPGVARPRGPASPPRAAPAAPACASAVVQPTIASLRLVREQVVEARPASPRSRRRRSAPTGGGHGDRARRPPAAGARARGARCAAGSEPATSHPGRVARAAPRSGRRPAPADLRRAGRARPRSRPTTATSAPSPRPTSGISGVR